MAVWAWILAGVARWTGRRARRGLQGVRVGHRLAPRALWYRRMFNWLLQRRLPRPLATGKARRTLLLLRTDRGHEALPLLMYDALLPAVLVLVAAVVAR